MLPKPVEPSESEARAKVVALVLQFAQDDRRIKMGDERFAGEVGDYRYLFEGEDDLLHVAISRKDQEPIAVEEAREVMEFLLPDLPGGIVWLKPGIHSHHFYFGQDELYHNRL